MKKYIILLAGKSGSGKSTAAGILHEKYGWTEVKSFTTRPKRGENDTAHIFITEDEFDRIPAAEMAAYTEFDGHRYCATKAQVDAADIYVIDPAGIRDFYQNYDGVRKILLVYLDVPERTCIQRMLARGDSFEDAERRARHDREKFGNMLNFHPAPNVIHADGLSAEETAEKIRELAVKAS